MATTLYLRDLASDLGGAGQKALSVTPGAASTTAVTNTTASGTNIQVTKTAAGQVLTWFSQPLGATTISGSVTVNIRGLESSTSANAKAGITIEHTDVLGNVLSTIVANTAVPTSSSEYTTSDTAKNASFTPTSTSIAGTHRIKVTLFVKNQGTMGGGFTVTNSYDGPTAAAAGDTYVTFTENLFPAYSGGPQGWSSPAGVCAVYVRTGLAMATPIPAVTSSPPVITTTSLPGGITGQPYSATLAATGGTGPYTWSISAGSLPAGLTLSSAGVISGTPASPPGTASFTVKVTDANSSTATQPLTITILAVSSQQALRAKLPKVPLRGVYSGWSPGSADTSSGTGQVQWNAGGPPRNPQAGPVFRQVVRPAAASIRVLPPRGRAASNPGAPLRNPAAGPVFRPAVQALRARLPVPLLRGRTSSSPGAPLRNPGTGPVFRQAASPARTRIPQNAPRGRTGGNPGTLAATPAVTPFRPQGSIRARLQQPLLRGRAYSGAGAPSRNPGTGPAFRPAVQALRARLPVPLLRGRNASGTSQVRNPGPGPVLYPAAVKPVRAPVPQVFSKGRTGSNPGAPPRNPGTGPAFRQAQTPIRGRIVLPPRGRIASSPGTPPPAPPKTAPFQARTFIRAQQPPPRRGTCRTIRFLPLPSNPQPGPVFRQATSPVQARFPLPPRGRAGSNPGGPVKNPPPPGPAFHLRTTPVRLTPGLPPRGRISFNPGASRHNPGTGPAFRQATQPARTRIVLPPRGRTGSNPGPPPVLTPQQAGISSGQPAGIRVIYAYTGRASSTTHRVAPQNPGTGPVFRQAAQPARIRATLPPRGRTGSNPGAPVPPPPAVAVFVQRTFTRAQQPPPRRGTCRTVKFLPLPSNPGTGPVFRSRTTPVRITPVLPPRGRTGSNPGGPVPPPPAVAPFRPAAEPARARIPQNAPRGRVYAHPGAPLRNPGAGPVFRQAVHPVQARFPLPPRGRIASNPGIPVPPPPVPAKVYPAQGPARIRITLPPKGRTGSNPGGPVRNPHPGPVFQQAVKPIRAVIPQNAPRGRAGSNSGGPVQNIPFSRIRVTLDQPYTSWEAGGPHTRWASGRPEAAGSWAAGQPDA